MKCPQCDGGIGVFSAALNSFGTNKTCPYCNKKLRMRISWRALLLLLPVGVLLHFFVLKPVVMITGFSGSGLAAIVGTFIALGTFRLYSNESE